MTRRKIIKSGEFQAYFQGLEGWAGGDAVEKLLSPTGQCCLIIASMQSQECNIDIGDYFSASTDHEEKLVS